MSTRRAGGHYDATMQLYVDGELLPREAANRTVLLVPRIQMPPPHPIT